MAAAATIIGVHAESVWHDLVESHAELGIHAQTDGIPVHEPRAAVLACADARVAPNLLFGQAPGALFVVRVAGNTAVPTAVASLDYAVAQLGVELVVVLGHTFCGAVTAACSGVADPHLDVVLDPIKANGIRVGDEPNDASVINVEAALARLSRSIGPVGQRFRDGQLSLRGAVHDLASGSLSPVAGPTHVVQPEMRVRS